MRSLDLSATTDHEQIEHYARAQRTLLRRFRALDPKNVLAVGFGPKVVAGETTAALSTRVFVRRKRAARTAKRSRIPASCTIRCRCPHAGVYRTWVVPTDVEEARAPQGTGVQVSFLSTGRPTNRRTNAVSSLVVRWTDDRPGAGTGDLLAETEAAGPALFSGGTMRYGLLTVAHAIPAGAGGGVVIARKTVCGDQPTEIEGQVIYRGLRSGAPDAAIVETTFDRLWLSGFLRSTTHDELPLVHSADWLAWLDRGAEGYWHGDRVVGRWLFSAYFPQLTISGLGSLQHVIRFRWGGGERNRVAAADRGGPFLPGTSGAALMQGGRVAALQVAAEAPGFEDAYAQLISPTLDAVQKRFQHGSALRLIGVF